MPRIDERRPETLPGDTRFVRLDNGAVTDRLPPPEVALAQPNGLLALGGDLNPDTLLGAYAQGVFPWFNEGEAMLWWSPDPRCVLLPEQVRVSRSLGKRLRTGRFQISLDRCFDKVIDACAAPRDTAAQTWITGQMRQAYRHLHHLGHAHSVEVTVAGSLVGGLYGVALGGAFFGESMFHRQPDASKIALVILCRQLVRWGYTLVDCQVSSSHLLRMGAVDMAREQFLRLLARALKSPRPAGSWILDDDL